MNDLPAITLAECNACSERFPYGPGTATRALGECPDCGSLRWERWGVRVDGEDTPLDVGERVGDVV